MKTIENPSTIIKYLGKICEVVGIANDEKVLFIREVGGKPCECCGEIKEYAVVENSPNFQKNVEAVITLIDK